MKMVTKSLIKIAVAILFWVSSAYPYAFMLGKDSEMNSAEIYVSLYSQLADKKIPAIASWSIAHHTIHKGNKGRGAEWSSQEIIKKNKLQPGTPLYFYVVVYEHWLKPQKIYRGEIAPNGKFGFIIKKVMVDNIPTYRVIPSEEATNEYEPAKN